ncbi:MAG: amidohydrolase [Candidatus Thorarchaeota archaeon]
MLSQIDFVVINADIRTMDSQLPKAEAMVISNGRILAIGRGADIEIYLRQAIKTVDMEGRTILPGFIDTHAHLVGLGRKIIHLDLGNTTSIEEALQLVKQRAGELAKGELILGYNWDESHWKNPRYLTKEDLDPITPNNPAILIRVCGHLISVNSLVLDQLDFNPNQEGVDRNPKTGELTGILRDIPVDPRKFQTNEEDLSKVIMEGCRYANSVGITSLHENLYRDQLPFVAAYIKLRQEKELTVRVYANLEAKLIDLLAALGAPSGFGDDYFRLGGVKVFTDGSFGAQTAAISKPYNDKPETTGLMLFAEEDYDFLIQTANHLGLQVSTHAIGDRAIAMVLRVHEKTSKSKLVHKLRHNIIHAEYLTPPLMKRVKKLDMLLLQQPNFVHRWGLPNGMYDSRLGPHRAKQLNNFRRILDAGIKVAFGSDCMPMDPLYGIYSATTHPYDSIRITIEEAIRLYTIDAAYASFDEKDKGSLTPGKLADFIVLSQNPLAMKPEELNDVEVLATYVGGKCVFSRL